MTLRITLKPSEQIIIGGALVVNGSSKTEFSIENETVVLREKDILSLENANTPCKKVYLALQLMYVDETSKEFVQSTYFDMIMDIQEAAPSTAFFFREINEHLLEGDYYRALKVASSLIEYEKELLK
jgi:flagellar protein FlbT